ncbi:hypothetical protein [Microvirga mediterraneensis]|uniref:Uncharacterized protein n=1 Tax=Microvirga mediterraneensis TaxID=2754695 RepID=A0A838BPL6_9HYPH|nr:hypothetical protein [Microvirga mediterraneensis]MBA1157684.1 hypothetical protein [Microvirga mediterraneensis]
MNRVWTEEELEILRRDREAKVPVPVTAAKLGRPVPATYARARLIGTLVQPHQTWDEASVARLRELVSADPPLTDKLIAAELDRTVTQIRWKMQDLGLIGVRDLSKLAKITAAGMARPKPPQAQSLKPATTRPAAQRPVRSPAPERIVPVARTEIPAPSAASAARTVLPSIDVQAAIVQAIRTVEASLAEHLKTIVAETEAGMIRAARAAIAEKGRIDQRLVIRVKRSAEAAARRDAEARKAQAEAKQRQMEAWKAEAEAKRQVAEAARHAREEAARRVHEEKARAEKARQEKAREEKALREKAQPAAPKPVQKPKEPEKKAVLSSVQGVSQVAPLRPAPQPVAPTVPKIVVTEAPAAPRAEEPETAGGQTSGRGGWKSVRRDPARALAQAKAKAKPANRADAIDLAQAAQAAIERFIAERGVTKSESSGIQSVVSRLQARGYIVVRDETGWTIDQRHRVGSESELFAFAEARGITLSAAA